jgi:hypothetical protein
LSAQQQLWVDRTRAALAKRREAATGQDADSEPAGILTSMTRQLSPERAIELYRKITPVFVYQVLDRLYQSASLRVVHEIVEHLCSDEVQARLRACEHVRDGILDEFCTVLGQSEIRQQLSREDLQHLLEECGAANDLLAMENCIRLASAKAG